MSVRQIIGCCRGESAIGGEFAYQRVEVSASEHSVVTHLEVKFVTCHAEFVSIDKYREVGVVVPYTGHVVEERDSIHIA